MFKLGVHVGQNIQRASTSFYVFSTSERNAV